ncbi:MAG: hypothetical protein ABS38_14100 [Acidovorax sp. SCN 68-22]|nr:MAG: hypothetical protein ABS38_14100 [Acidovorax sp. SCN 68-22]
MVARVRASTFAFASSNVTLASRRSRFTSILLTPETLVSAFLTVIGQVAQFIPGTDSVTLCVAAQRGEVIAANAARATSFFMAVSFQ